MIKENWMPVVGFESHYEVSDLGNVRSVERVLKNKHSYRKLKPRVLKPQTDKDGYFIVTLSMFCKTYKRRVHILVMMSFKGYKNNDYQKTINHINHIKSDNKLSNLEVMSRRKNSSQTKENKTNLPIGLTISGKKYQVRKSINGKRHYLGLHDTIEKAVMIYNSFN